MTASAERARPDAAAESSAAGGELLIDNVARLCKSAIGGRRASRVLADWAQRFALSEAEIHLLWALRNAPGDGRDQKTLAGGLAFSAAQVSATVERLRARELLNQQAAPGDRRRNLWTLSDSGRALLAQMLDGAAALGCEALAADECAARTAAREAAA